MESLSDRFKAENHSLLLGAVGLQELGDAVTTQMSYYNVAARWGPELGATGASCREPDSAVLCSPTNRQARWQYDYTPAQPPRVQRLQRSAPPPMLVPHLRESTRKVGNPCPPNCNQEYNGYAASPGWSGVH